MAAAPPQPTYVLRGHSAAIHALCFLRGNTRLVTGDADGWVVVWDMATKRAVAVWKAHEGVILGLREWGRGEGLVTHGKDNKLIVWKLREEEEAGMSTTLPVDKPAKDVKQPWLIHVLHVNTLNFCAFGMCDVHAPYLEDQAERAVLSTTNNDRTNVSMDTLVAVPNTLTSEAVDIFQLPSEKRIHTVPGNKAVNTGMVMAVSIFLQNTKLTLVVGYESGHTMVTQELPNQGWQVLYFSQPHKQPVLSLDVLPDQSAYFTSSADAIIAKHPIPSTTQSAEATFPPLSTTSAAPTGGGLSALLSSQPSSAPSPVGTSSKPPKRKTTPLKIIQTKHSGQQSLTIRSDSKIFATGGWDTKVRVYSVAGMKEVAVLKWHKAGCYAVAFAKVDARQGGEREVGVDGEAEDGKGNAGVVAVKQEMSLSFKDRRIRKAENTHWLAAGSKDGKVSLWDVY